MEEERAEFGLERSIANGRDERKCLNPERDLNYSLVPSFAFRTGPIADRSSWSKSNLLELHVHAPSHGHHRSQKEIFRNSSSLP